MDTDLIIAGVLAGVAVLLVAAYVTRIPYPILLVVGGVGLGFIPGVPHLVLEPKLVLLILLPPLLYSAAFFSSLRDLQRNLRPITMLAVGLVLFTTVGVAAIAHWLTGMAWEPAFVLGAVVSPTDPVAATAIARRVGAPRRVISVVEGESLVNDSTALIAYKFAVAAALSGSFSAAEAGGRFLLNAVVGVGIGIAVGYVVAAVRARIEDPPTEITLSIATPYFAYLPADALGVSAVLAAVTAGIWLGWRSPRLISPSTRIQAFAVWEVLQFLLNATLFTLVGLALPDVLSHLEGQSAGELVRDAVIVSAAVMAVRFLWVFPTVRLPRLLSRRLREREPAPPWGQSIVVAWTGMRGAVSLAAALAIPLAVRDRDLIIFLTYAVIASTLLVQGLSLPFVIRALGVGEDGKEAYKESKARMKAAEAAIARVDELRVEEWVRDETADRVRQLYDYRRRRFASRFAEDGTESERFEERSVAYQRLLHEIFSAQRDAIVSMRNEGRINDEVMHRIERDLDLEESRLEV
ncbi:MAG: Na+/H+ antiporter [Actinobacteria bacterium]|nr:MAG: Na+/H+ antiporter [Actinomycetota bacterium]